MKKYISLKDFRKHPQDFSWGDIQYICCHQKLSEKFMWDMFPYLDWTYICIYQDLSEDFIRKAKKLVNWEALCCWEAHKNFSEKFLDEFKNKLNWKHVSRWQTFSKEFVLNHLKYVKVNEMFRNEKLTSAVRNIEVLDAFLKYNPNSFDWTYPYLEGLTIDFIREHKKEITNWRHIASKFKKNMKFHNEFSQYYNKEAWEFLSDDIRDYSYDFILRYIDKWKFTYLNLPINSTNNLSQEDIKILRYIWNWNLSAERYF